VLRVDWRRPDLRRAVVVIPQSEVVVQEVQAAADALYVRDLDGGLHRLRRLPYGGGEALAVPLPVQGSMRGPHVAADQSGAIVRLRSWTQPNTIYRYDPAAGTLADLHWQAPAAADFSGVEAREVKVVGHDGTLVPLSIVMRKGTPLDGTHPTLLSSYGAYGGFGTASPYFDPTLLAWIERGGIHAVAHPRGGGEYGEEWHRDGMKLTKLNTVFDTIACAQYLVERAYASPKTLAIEGASAGGITVGGAINWRPDLFAAAIVHAGISDALRAEFSANGPVNVPEFGSVKDLQGFRGLHAMSPYAHVRAGAAYPAVLLEAGWNDPRVDAWQSGKMAARLQAATASGKPVLLRVDFDSGHFGGTREQSERLLADEWAFLLWQFGDPEFQPAP
jgi:prolyl oligopeptidase